ncbi:aldolase/citrate lyase family protein [uncultured Amphritea sp.]|uniref:aldolase/citrate lyase family protein n=1 Tax=uncultured Amphritea sp. TaxID=981605 RepID=UPI0026073454|nr:aldolase/citrate lyase family protein [uncultured Amphritea sp.]
MINYILITNDPDLAFFAQDCGVRKIFIDLERLGKVERQGHLDTLISQHAFDDIPKVKSVLSTSELLVRLNPFNDNTYEEIEASIAGGAETLILPMFRSGIEVGEFCRMVDGRAGVMPLVETYDAAMDMRNIVSVNGVTEVYIGLNDLHLDMGLAFMFQPVSSGLIDSLAIICKKNRMPFGFGGIARVGEGVIPGEMVLAEHLRLGSSSVILSRTFHRKSNSVEDIKANMNLKFELSKLIEAENQLRARSHAEIDADRKLFLQKVESFVVSLNEKNI